MLSGADNLIKPDRWIISFIKEALGVTLPPNQALALLSGSCEILKEKYPDLSPRLLDNTIWKQQRGEKDKVTKQAPISCVVSRSDKQAITDSNIGPFERSEIILCSADAGPGAQQQEKEVPREAEYLFPGAKWVRAIGNSARRQNCRFVILTTAHGMVNPDDSIKPYDLHVEAHQEMILGKWRETIPALLDGKGYKLLVFYSGGCPRDSMMEIMTPILNDMGINVLSFGRPNMWDVGKTDSIVELLQEGTSLCNLRSLLKVPERLVYYPRMSMPGFGNDWPPFEEIWRTIRSPEGKLFHTPKGLTIPVRISTCS